MLQGRLGTPAQREHAVYMAARPVEDTPQLVPVDDLLERHLLDRRTGDDQPVELLLADLLPRPVEVDHVLARRVLRHVAGRREHCHLDLQRRARQHARDLRLRSEEHTSELQSLMRISYAVFCLKKTRPSPASRNTQPSTTYY